MTYLNIFDKVRKLFAEENHVSPALFSYNSKGACPTCKGKEQLSPICLLWRMLLVFAKPVTERVTKKRCFIICITEKYR